MSFVAVAIGGAAVVGAGASLIGASKAAKAQKNAAGQATAEQQREYDTSRADLQPYRDAGYTALGQLTNLTSGDPATVEKQLTADPGYQFGLDQGVKATQATAAARGGVLSGGAQKALARYGTDYAGTKLNDSFNRLAAVAGIGQTATNAGVAAGENTSNNISQNILQAGNATASQYAAGANAIGGAANSIGQYFALKSLANPTAATASGYGGYTGTGDYGYGSAGAYGIAGSDGIY